MKRTLISLFTLVFALSLVETGVAQDCSRTKRIVKNTAIGAASTAVLGLIVGGKKGAKDLGIVGAGLGAVSGVPTPAGCQNQNFNNSQVVLSDAQERAARQHPSQSYITPANQRTRSEEEDMPPVWIRSFNGQANPQVLNAIIRRPFDQNGYGTLDPTQPPDPKDPNVYFVDIVTYQQDDARADRFSNVSGPNGSVSSSDQGGTAKFWVSVSTYRKGRWVRDLSVDRAPVATTLRGANYQISTRIHDINIQNGGNAQVVSVDPSTQAAEKAIRQAFRLR